MHIPDGFLGRGGRRRGVPAAGAVAFGLRGASREFDERRVPLLGVTAAFVFAAQMLNFPVAGGTSGHFLGAALAAVLLGPWLACLVMAVVLVTQAFLFADGGVTALGANVLNMGVVGALGRRADARGPGGAAAPPRRSARRERRGRVAGRDGRRDGGVVRARDLGDGPARHRAAGDARRPRADRHRRGGRHRRRGQRGARVAPRPSPGSPRDHLEARRCASSRSSRWPWPSGWHRPSPFASSSPDGLERVADARRSSTRAAARDKPIAGYAFPGIRDERLATGVAGFAGTLGVLAIGYGVEAVRAAPAVTA